MVELSDVWPWAVDQIQQSWVSVGAAIVSLISAFAAASQKRQEMRIAWIKDLIQWASNAMLALARACVEVSREGDAHEVASVDRINEIRAQLSAAIDQGRLFFENQKTFRPDVLDPLVRAFDLLSAAQNDPERYTRSHLIDCMGRHRTEFWKVVQAKVDPAWIRKAVQGPHPEGGDGAWDFDKADQSSRRAA